MGHTVSHQYNNSPKHQSARVQHVQPHQTSLCTDCKQYSRSPEQSRLQNYPPENKQSFRRLGSHRQLTTGTRSHSVLKSYYPVSYQKKRESTQLETSSNQLSRMLKKLTLEDSRQCEKCSRQKTPLQLEVSLFQPNTFQQMGTTKQFAHQQQISEFVSSQQRFLEKREMSIERSRKQLLEQTLKDCTYRPELNKKSLLMAERRKKRSTGIPTMRSFKALNIDLPLKKRVEQQQLKLKDLNHQPQPAQLITTAEKTKPSKYPPYIGNSNFIQSFLGEFCTVIKEVGESSRLTYLEVSELLKHLGFVGTVERTDSRSFILERSLINDMWILISSKGGWADPLSLLSFLLALFQESISNNMTHIERIVGRQTLQSLIEHTSRNSREHLESPPSCQKRTANEDTSFQNKARNDISHFLKTDMKTPPKQQNDLSNQLFSLSEQSRVRTITVAQSSDQKKDTPKKRIFLKKSDDTVKKPNEASLLNCEQTSKKVSLAAIFQSLGRSRNQTEVQLSAGELGVSFGSRRDYGYVMYSPEEIQEINFYFKHFATNKLHRMENHRYATPCFNAQPLVKRVESSTRFSCVPDQKAASTLPPTYSEDVRNSLANRRKERIVKAARTMRLIKQCENPSSSAQIRKIEELLKERSRKDIIRKAIDLEDASCTFQPKVHFASQQDKPPMSKYLQSHQKKHQKKLSAPVSQNPPTKFNYTVCNEPDVILQVDVHIDSRKLTMQLTDRDTPTSATERFLKNNAISSKWRSQITSKVQQALLDIHNEDHQYH